jgi:predicted amidohydrolase
MVCYDMWFPEIIRLYSINGVDAILIPTNWPVSKKENSIEDITDKILISHAHMNGVFIAACDHIGVERGVTFKGRSIIINPDGKVLAGPAGRDTEEIISAECNLVDSRKKSSSSLNNIMGDRRNDIYILKEKTP